MHQLCLVLIVESSVSDPITITGIIGEGFTDVGLGTPVSPGVSTSPFQGNSAFNNGLGTSPAGTNQNYNMWVNEGLTIRPALLNCQNSTGIQTPTNPSLYNAGVHNISTMIDGTLPPSVMSVSPNTSPTSGGTSVVIVGTSFTGVTGVAGVKFGGTNATSYVVNSDSSITAVAPAGAAGVVDITVVTPGGTSPVVFAGIYTYL